MSHHVNKQITNEAVHINVNLRVFSLIGLVLILIYALLSRGLYFNPELLVGLIITGIILAFAAADTAIRGETDFFRFSVDYFITGLTLAYLLSVFQAVSRPDAIIGVLTYICYLAVFFITCQSVRTWRSYRNMMEVIYAGGVLVALIGLSAATGLFRYPGAYQSKQICSTFQYQNALAVFVLTVLLIGLSLWVSSDRKLPWELWYITGSLLLSIVLLGTSSRAVWIMSPIVLAVWISGLNKSQRLSACFKLGYVCVTSVLIGRVFFLRVESGQGQQALAILVSSILVSWVVWMAMLRADTTIEKKHALHAVKKFWRVLGIVYLAVIIVVYAVYAINTLPGGWGNLVPADLTNQLAGISGRDQNLLARSQFTKDAVRIILDYPWLGTGAGGWAVLYQKYKSMPYTAAEVHNNYAQIAVETGIPGFLIYCSIWIVMFYWAYRMLRHFRKHPKWPLAWGITTALLAVAVHSAIDFELSLPAVSIIVWVFFGLIRNGYMLAHREQHSFKLRNLSRLVPLVVGLGVALVLMVPAYRFYRAGILGADGALAMQTGNIAVAEERMKAAAQLDPFNGSYLIDLSKINIVKWHQTGDNQFLEQGMTIAQMATQMEPFNIKIKEGFILCSLSAGRINEAYQAAEQVVADYPFEIKAYEVLANVGAQGAIYNWDKGDMVRAREYIDRVTEIPQVLDQMNAKIAGNSLVAGYESLGKLNMTPPLNLSVGQANLLQGRFAEGISLLMQVGGNQEADQWLAAALNKRDRKISDRLIEKWGTKDKGFRSSVEQVEQLISRAKI